MVDSMDDAEARRDLAEHLRFQALADPFYGVLLDALADEIVAGGPAWRPLAQIAHVDGTQNLPLRLMGAAHRAALGGTAPDYAAHLPTCGGDGDAQAAWPAFRALCESGALDEEVHRPVQTNEPRRATALLPGFAEVHRTTGLPLRLLELGASAGLLARFDRYRYEYANGSWGDPGSPVRLATDAEAPLGPVVVAERRGCDPNPLDPVADRLLLLGFVWPTQVERFRLVEAALDLAASQPVAIDRAGAGDWLTEALAEPVPGVATVVYHSVVWQYIPPDEQRVAESAIHTAGQRATADAPLAWLRFESHRDVIKGAELSLTTWPGGDHRSLALAGYHGEWLRWGPAPD
jgi:hypothetical protein